MGEKEGNNGTSTPNVEPTEITVTENDEKGGGTEEKVAEKAE